LLIPLDNGQIDEKEFVGVLKNRCYYGASETGKGVNKPIEVLKESFWTWKDKL